MKATPEGEIPLPAEEKVGGFRSSPPTYDDLDPKEVQPFIGVPDYMDPTLSPYPLVVESDGVYHCIDGWEMIQKAIGEGKDRITCDVFHVPGCSETELSIRKASVRMMPKGGVARYPEIIRNVRIISDRLISSVENPVIYPHGGDRRGEGFTKNREDNFRILLAERLGKSYSTICKHLNHAEYLTDDALAILIQTGAKKDFFEDAQMVKQRLLANLKSSGATEEEICTQISEAMIRMNGNPEEIETMKEELLHVPEKMVEAEEEPSSAPRNPKTGDREIIFDHWNGDQNWSDTPHSEEEIRRDGAAISERIKVAFEDKELSLPALKEAVTGEIQNFLSVLRRLDELEILRKEEN